MSPSIASILFVCGIIGLFLLVRDRTAKTSAALWLPITWIAIGGTRALSEWLAGGGTGAVPDQRLDGSPLDQVILSGLLILGLAVLAARGRRSGAFLRENAPILIFLVYCAISVVWSDFPLIAFKRWIRAFGNVVMVFIVLTDPNPTAALKRFFARTGFLLISLSVLLARYYPRLGRVYDRWDGTPHFVGIADTKNGLGCICLVFGIGAIWNLSAAFRDKSKRTRALLAYGSVLAMIGWLMLRADSATSLACLALGGAVIAITIRGEKGRPATVHLTLIGLLIVGLLAQEAVIEILGRDPTLTGRSDLWNELLRMHREPWLGTGFESFFIGPRAKFLWDKYWWHPNEAHNGYLEVYLTLGWVGVGLLTLVIVTGYRNVVNIYRQDVESGAIRLALFAVALTYNLTESAFRLMHPIWIVFLLVAAAVPVLATEESAVPLSDVAAKKTSRAAAGMRHIANRQPRPYAGRVHVRAPGRT